jgi:hypothetical protein
MSDSITQHIQGAGFSSAQQRALLAAFAAVVADQGGADATMAKVKVDLTSIATQFNQLRTDYNANETIATDTTATAITLTSTT